MVRRNSHAPLSPSHPVKRARANNRYDGLFDPAAEDAAMADTDDNDEGDIDPSLAEAAEGDEVDGGGKKNANNDEVSPRPLLVHPMFAFAFVFVFAIRVTGFTWS
jgi:hypothetical protein